jgi:lipoate-protein ligase B
LIVPCGIAERRATSLEKLLGRRVEMKEIAPRIVASLGGIFGLGPRPSTREALEALLEQQAHTADTIA